MSKRSKEEDDFIDDDDDPSAKKKAPASKKGKQAAAAGAGASGDDDVVCELGNNRRVTVSTFKGKSYVNIREYYEKDGALLPGKKGIMLTPEQFAVLKANVDAVSAELAKKG